MILVRFYACLMILVSAAKFIDASCLSYGHSCWGAHGKRSYNPQREVKSNEFNHWAALKFPERNEMYQYKKLLRDNSIQQQMRYPNNDVPVNFPVYEDDSERSARSESSDDPNEIQRAPSRLINDLKSYQEMRLNKQIPSITQ